jgi:uncharacterized protein (UPF0210 family)
MDLDGYWEHTRELVIVNEEKRVVKECRAIEKLRGAELAAAAKLVREREKDVEREKTRVDNAGLKEIADELKETKRLLKVKKLQESAEKKRLLEVKKVKTAVVKKLAGAAAKVKLASYERAEMWSVLKVGEVWDLYYVLTSRWIGA